MKEIPLTQGKVALVDDTDYDWLMQWKWHMSMGYARRDKEIDKNRRSYFMHRQIMEFPVGLLIDHINLNPLDNQRHNLRVCTAFQNRQNITKQSNNKSGYKGVYLRKDGSEWIAHISFGGTRKMTHLGCFDNPIDAALAYDKKAREVFGEFARTNFEKEK